MPWVAVRRHGRVFSKAMSMATTAIQAAFLRPMRNAPDHPSRHDPRSRPSGLRHLDRQTIFKRVSSYPAATGRVGRLLERPLRGPARQNGPRRDRGMDFGPGYWDTTRIGIRRSVCATGSRPAPWPRAGPAPSRCAGPSPGSPRRTRRTRRDPWVSRCRHAIHHRASRSRAPGIRACRTGQ